MLSWRCDHRGIGVFAERPDRVRHPESRRLIGADRGIVAACSLDLTDGCAEGAKAAQYPAEQGFADAHAGEVGVHAEREPDRTPPSRTARARSDAVPARSAVVPARRPTGPPRRRTGPARRRTGPARSRLVPARSR